MEDHKKRRHTKECEEKLVCRNEREQQKKEEHRERFVCNLCEEKFKEKNELREHWEKDHEGPVYECVHIDCEDRYLSKEMCRDHMKEKHGIGNYCELCNEYYLSKDGLERHMKYHVTEVEYEEDLEGIECKQCCETFETML